MDKLYLLTDNESSDFRTLYAQDAENAIHIVNWGLSEPKTWNAQELKPFAVGTLPDGYFGATVDVEFYLIPTSGKIVAKGEFGFFPVMSYLAANTEEAYWLLTTHPSSTATNVKRL